MNLLLFTPGPDAGNFEYFTYDVEDDDGDTDTVLVTVYVDVAIPSSPLEVSPSPIDFGEVPLGKTADVELTVTNTGSASVGPMFVNVEQAAPEPFDIGLPGVHCIDGPLSPGDSCVLKVRFWSLALRMRRVPRRCGSAASHHSTRSRQFRCSHPRDRPYRRAHQTPTPSWSTTPSARRQENEQTIDALFNDSDPDADQLRISGAAGAQHGSVDGIVHCANFIFREHAQHVCADTPNPGFVGIDQIAYTITDSRGRSDGATIYVAVATLTVDRIPG